MSYHNVPRKVAARKQQDHAGLLGRPEGRKFVTEQAEQPPLFCIYCERPDCFESVTKYPSSVVKSKPKMNHAMFEYFRCFKTGKYFMRGKSTGNAYRVAGERK